MNGRSAGQAVPPFRPLMSAATNLVRNVRLSAQQQPPQQQPLLKPLPVPAFAALPESIAKVAVETPSPPPPPSLPSPQLVAVQRQPGPGAAVVMPVAVVGRLPHGQPQMTVKPAIVPVQMPTPSTLQRPQNSAVYRHDAMQQAANRRFNVSPK